MDVDRRPQLRPLALIGSSFAALVRPPIAILVALELLVSLVGATLGADTDPFTLLASITLAVITVYLDIGVTLAAAHPDVSGAEAAVRAAFGRRCFWRYVLGGALAMILVVAGGLLLVVGAFVVGGIVALAQPAAALERRTPGDAVRRSSELTKGSRPAVALVFGLFVIVPTAGAAAAVRLQDAGDLYGVGVSLGTTLLTAVASVALARAFVILGGSVEPDAAHTYRRPSRS